MKKIFILIFVIHYGFSQEFEVDGNLKVIGNIDASNQRITNVGSPTTMQDAVNTEFLQEALSNDGPFEYLAYKVKIYTNTEQENIEWIELGENASGSWESNFISRLNILAMEGYEIHSTINLPYAKFESGGGSGFGWGASHTNDVSYTLFILRRTVYDE